MRQAEKKNMIQAAAAKDDELRAHLDHEERVESELDTVQAHYLQLQAEKALLGATKDQELEVQVAKAAKELGALQEEYALLQAAKASMAAAKDEEAPSMPT